MSSLRGLKPLCSMMKLSSCFLLYLIVAVCFTPSKLQDVSECVKHTKCNKCIQIPGCAWCSDKDYLQRVGPGCNSAAKLKDNGCPANQISNPNSLVEELESETVGQAGIQVSPQKVKLHLRPGIPAKLRVTVRSAENYPVDLYYLMDMSLSMEDDLQKLKALGGTIADGIRNITGIFQIGFGSFVDKPVAPYLRVEQKKPCADHIHCEPSYGFRNVQPLDPDQKKFQELVKKQNISGNLDEPEGGLDALMQVAVCGKEIGWSPFDTSRRLVILVTDAPFHMAGDGKLGGIIKRNDEKCHLVNNEYSKTRELDYPTLAQLHDKLKENQIQPIFAVTDKVLSFYTLFSEKWSDLNAVTGKLNSDSSNIVDLIRESYNKISSTVRMSHTTSDGITISYQAKCKKDQSKELKECLQVGIADSVYFDLTVTMPQCPKDASTKPKPVLVQFPGFGRVNIEVEPICNCDCEKKREVNSTKCSGGFGAITCGVCDCNEGRYGRFCECDNPFDHRSGQCTGNGTDDVPCSGRGQCVCGVCECAKDDRGLIYGERCECDTFNCPQHRGKKCGGEKQGDCRCGQCHCKGVYIGVNCGQRNCSMLDDECRKSPISPICSGSDRGQCVCGKCVCEAGYIGEFCEKCPGCAGGICSRNKDCVVCTAGLQKVSLDQCKNSNRCEALVESVDSVTDITIKTSKGLYRCDHKDANDCLYLYTYEEISTDMDPKRYKLYVERRCPEEPNILPIVLGVIGGILGIGLILLLIWKLLIMLATRIEYERFQKELQTAKFNQHVSPLYRNPITTTLSPIYSGSKK